MPVPIGTGVRASALVLLQARNAGTIAHRMDEYVGSGQRVTARYLGMILPDSKGPGGCIKIASAVAVW
jgi:hypothetical protein